MIAKQSEIQEAYIYSSSCTQKVIIQKRTGEKETHLSISSRLEAQVFTGKWDTNTSTPKM